MAGKTEYYLDDDGGLWKSENNSEYYYFSRILLQWIKCKACFFGFATYMLNPIDDKKLQKILSNFETEGKKDKDTLPFQYQYYEYRDEFLAEDIYGNEFYVLPDMTFKRAPRGTIKEDWKGFHVEEAKSRIIGSIFEICHRYTSSDEDYEYDIRIFKDGSVYVGQSETYCYRPKDIIFEFTKSENLKSEIINLFNKYKSEIDTLEPAKEKDPWGYSGKIQDKEFALPYRTEVHFIQEIKEQVIDIIEEFYPNQVNWKVSIHR